MILTEVSEATEAVAAEARRGLLAERKSLAPWLFYDEVGSRLFEEITALEEYYLTRAEREIFAANAEDIFDALGANIAIAELGAGTAAKTGILLRALARRQARVLYQPIDISPSALDEAREAHSPAVDERDPPAPEEHAEAGALLGDAEIAPARELEPAGDPLEQPAARVGRCVSRAALRHDRQRHRDRSGCLHEGSGRAARDRREG